MTQKQRNLHRKWCDLMVERAGKQTPIVCIINRRKSPKGIKTSGDSKAVLARKLAEIM